MEKRFWARNQRRYKRYVVIPDVVISTVLKGALRHFHCYPTPSSLSAFFHSAPKFSPCTNPDEAKTQTPGGFPLCVISKFLPKQYHRNCCRPFYHFNYHQTLKLFRVILCMYALLLASACAKKGFCRISTKLIGQFSRISTKLIGQFSRISAHILRMQLQV